MSKKRSKVQEYDDPLDAYLDYDREEFLKRCEEEGIQNAMLERGIERGIGIGREEGREEERLNNAKNLILKGYEQESIIKDLNLSQEEIDKLEADLKAKK